MNNFIELYNDLKDMVERRRFNDLEELKPDDQWINVREIENLLYKYEFIRGQER